MHDTRHIFSTSLSKFFPHNFSHQFTKLKLCHLGTKNYAHVHPSILLGLFSCLCFIGTDLCLHVTPEIHFILLHFPTPALGLYNHLLHSLKAKPPLSYYSTLKRAKKSLCPSLRAKSSFITPKLIRA